MVSVWSEKISCGNPSFFPAPLAIHSFGFQHHHLSRTRWLEKSWIVEAPDTKFFFWGPKIMHPKRRGKTHPNPINSCRGAENSKLIGFLPISSQFCVGFGGMLYLISWNPEPFSSVGVVGKVSNFFYRYTPNMNASWQFYSYTPEVQQLAPEEWWLEDDPFLTFQGLC